MKWLKNYRLKERLGISMWNDNPCEMSMLGPRTRRSSLNFMSCAKWGIGYAKWRINRGI